MRQPRRITASSLVRPQLLVEVELLQRRLVAGDEQEDRVLVGSVDVLVPGAARDGERVETAASRSVGHPRSNDRYPRMARPAGSRSGAHGSERSPGRRHLHQERDRLETPAGRSSDQRTRPSRCRGDRRPGPYAVRAARASSPSDTRTSARRSRRRAFPCRRTAASIRRSRRCAANSPGQSAPSAASSARHVPFSSSE